MAVDWSKRGEYIVRKHNVTPTQANEALEDPQAVVFNPDYNSQSGESIRTIGYSPSYGALISVITVNYQGTVYGATAFRSEAKDRRYYQQEQE